jgi:phospholipase/lecithinase/hemolysin
VLALLTALIITRATFAANIDNLFVFGDSLSDTGNAYAASVGNLPPSPPYFNGRASNGPIWVEHLAQTLGAAPVTPFYTSGAGTNYAFFNAETGPGASTQYGMPNVGMQINAFLNTPRPVTSRDVFVLWAGPNDVYYGGETDPVASVGRIADHITTLTVAGASRFLVPNMPLLGNTPAAYGAPEATPLNMYATGFNMALSATLDQLRGHLRVRIDELDVATIFNEVMADPTAYGLTNVTEPALSPDFLSVAPNPNEHLFWDGVHPTTAGHRLLANAAASAFAIPEPTTLAAAGVILGALAVRRRALR